MEGTGSCLNGALTCRCLRSDGPRIVKHARLETARFGQKRKDCGPSNVRLPFPPDCAKRFLAGIFGTAITGAIIFNPHPAFADMIETVNPASVTQYAQPLPQQEVDKGRVWLLLTAGAASLFFGTLALESRESLFPAIAKANKAMAMSQTEDGYSEEPVDEEGAPVDENPLANEPSTLPRDDYSLFSAVEEGLAEARREIMAEYSSPENTPRPEGFPFATHSDSTSSQGRESTDADEGQHTEINGRFAGSSEQAEKIREGEVALEKGRTALTGIGEDGGEDAGTMMGQSID